MPFSVSVPAQQASAVTSVPGPGALPTDATGGDLRYSISNSTLYAFNGASWQPVVTGAASAFLSRVGTMTTATTTTFTHTLGQIPGSVFVTYFDGTSTTPVDPAAVVTDQTTTTITVNSGGFTFGGGKNLKIYVAADTAIGSM